jgi:hypothetical protein
MSTKVRGSTVGDSQKVGLSMSGKPSYVDGEGYPHGLIWLDGNDKKDSTIMLFASGDNEYRLYVRHAKNNEYTKWQYATSFHDYELKDLALAILDGAVEEDIMVLQPVKRD